MWGLSKVSGSTGRGSIEARELEGRRNILPLLPHPKEGVRLLCQKEGKATLHIATTSLYTFKLKIL